MTETAAWENRIIGHGVMPAEEFTANPENWRVHPSVQKTAITGVLSETGWIAEVMVNLRRGEEWGERRGIPVMVDGHLRVREALRKAPGTPVPYYTVDLTPEEERRALLTFDPIGAMAGAARKQLGELLERTRTQSAGVRAVLDRIAEQQQVKRVIRQDDGPRGTPEAILQAWQVQRGQVWAIPSHAAGHSEHRLLCGDAGDPDAMKALMAGQRADLVWTDPPYAVAENNSGVARSSDNRQMGALFDASWDRNVDLAAPLRQIEMALAEDATAYVCASHHTAPTIWQWMQSWAEHYSWCVWTKPNPMPSLMRRHWTWNAELVCYATRGRHTFHFPASGHAPSAWEFPSLRSSPLHPTMKPVPLVAHGIAHSSNAGDVVVDPFAGSGTTIVAAEQLGRLCYAMEVEPTYIAVALQRLRDLGLEPRLA